MDTQHPEKYILVINCGSSSLKYEVFKMPQRESLGKGLVERIGDCSGFLAQTSPRGEIRIEQPIADHNVAMALVAKALVDEESGIVDSLSAIHGVGHRVVHGGEKFASSVAINDDVMEALQENVELAPLHNPANIIGIEEITRLLPHVGQVGVFDTAFHQTMPPAAYLYGLPREFYDKYRIRRYGFHGTSHRFVAGRALNLMKRVAENTNLITCHLGNGASVTAIESGRSIDTSMGFTPLEGVMMGTRSGDIDPSILGFLEDRGYSSKDLQSILNKKSGLLGLSGVSNDLRDVEKAAQEGNANAEEALEVFAHKVRKYIGAYAAELVKVDGLVFTGGIGQWGAKMRARICRRLEHLGIVMDYNLNGHMGGSEGIVSHNYSRTTILVVPTNEELQIAMDTFEILYPCGHGDCRRKTDAHV
ncbi:MAG: acetate kinase [Holophagaceae bacterium]|nr:acetate kinase [Holophagaceae bacterium]